VVAVVVVRRELVVRDQTQRAVMEVPERHIAAQPMRVAVAAGLLQEELREQAVLAAAEMEELKQMVHRDQLIPAAAAEVGKEIYRQLLLAAAAVLAL
jgi:hypothetical protein